MNVLVCMVYSFACLCLGAVILRILGWKKPSTIHISPLTEASTAFILGQGVIAWIWTLLASFGMFSRFIIVVFLTIVTLAGLSFVYQVIKGVIYQLKKVFQDVWNETPAWQFIAFLTTVLIIIQGITCFLPLLPYTDPVTFYMLIAKMIASSHHIIRVPGYYEYFAVVGLLAELHYAALMSLQSVIAAKLFVFPVSLAQAFILVSLGSYVGLGRRGQWITAVALFSSTVFTLLIGDGKVDLYGTGLGITAILWCLYIGKGDKDTAILRIVGLLTGLAIVAKLSFVLALFPSVVLLILWNKIAGSRTSLIQSLVSLSSVKYMLHLCFWIFIAFIPNIVKNEILYSAPLAPIIWPQFSTQRFMSTNNNIFKTDTLLKCLLLYPFSLVYGKFILQYGNLSPLVIMFAPLTLLKPRTASFLHSRLFQVTVAALVGIFIYTFFYPRAFMPRYFLVPVLLLIPFGACGGEYISIYASKAFRLDLAVTISIIATLLITLGSVYRLHTYYFPPALPYLTGKVSFYNWPSPFDGVLPASEILNREAPYGARVYYFHYSSTFWFRPDLLQCMMKRKEIIYSASFEPELEGNDKKWEFLVNRGFTYIWYDKGCGFPLKSGSFPHPDSAPEWLNVEEITHKNNIIIYKITSLDKNYKPSCACRQKNPPAWNVIEQ